MGCCRESFDVRVNSARASRANAHEHPSYRAREPRDTAAQISRDTAQRRNAAQAYGTEPNTHTHTHTHTHTGTTYNTRPYTSANTQNHRYRDNAPPHAQRHGHAHANTQFHYDADANRGTRHGYAHTDIGVQTSTYLMIH